MFDMEEWLLEAYENGDIAKRYLRTCIIDKDMARELWLDFCDSDDFIENCQFQIERFLEMIDEFE